MKKILMVLLAVTTLTAVHAQCPQFLAYDTTLCGNTISRVIDARVLASQLCGDTLQIIFNATGTPLAGQSKVYLHSGPEFRPFTGWQGPYTVDTGSSQAGLMTSIGTNLWSIKFVPRNYFHYSVDSCLNSVAMGFRDSSNTIYVKDGANDIYLVTSTGTPYVSDVNYTNVTGSYINNTHVSYLWNDGNTDSVRIFTSGGNYTVTATGVGGCTATGTVRIRLDNSQVSIGDDTTECTTSSYVFVATPGFSTYQWNDAAPFTSNIKQAINPGQYIVRAVDSLGCVSSDTAQVHLSPTGYLSLPATLSSCPGTAVSADASTTINANGDSLVIVYDATKGLTQLIGDTNVYLYSAPQFYAFAGWPANDPYTVGNFNQNDGIGRMQSLGNNKWRIAINPQTYYHYSPDTPLIGIWMVFRNFDGTKTGKDSSTANNNNIYLYTVPTVPTSSFDGVTAYREARQPLTYTWSNGVHTAADTFTTSGTYYVTVTDGVCTHSDSVVVSFSTSAAISIGADTTVCAAGDTVLISATAGFVHYAWSTGDTTFSIRVHGAGTYSVTATNATGCSSLGHRSVSISNRTLSLGPDLVECTNAPTVLTANTGFRSYQWIDRAATASNTFSVTKTGCYWIQATDSAGCVYDDTISVRYSEVLQLSLTDTLRNCPGNFVDLDAGSNIAVNGDSITIFYNATQGQTGLINAHKVYMHSGPEFYPGTGWQGNYTVGNWGQDDGIGEMDSLGNNRWSITICPQCYYRYSPDTPLNGIWMVFRNADGSQTGKDNFGNNIFLNLATITPTSSFSGVTAIHKEAGTLSYLWSTGATAPAIAVGTSGQYKVTVTDNSGCSHSDTSTVIIGNTLTVNIGNDTTICSSGSVRFDAGAGFTAYRWSNGDSTRAITVSAPGTYSVTAYIGNCSAIDSATIHMSGLKINLGTDITRCTKAPTTITAPVGFTSYVWFGTGASSRTYSAINDGCYWVYATDSTGCTSYDTVCVSTSGVNGLDTHDTLNVCSGDSASFDASVSVNAHGDSLVIVFDATQNATSAPLLGASKIYMHSGPEFYPGTGWQGAYTVGNWGQDDGIGEMDSIGPNKWSITIFPSAYYHLHPDTPLNAIGMVFRNADGSLQSGTTNIYLVLVGAGAPYSGYAGVSGHYKSTNNITYHWSTGANTAVANFSTAGNYYVTATDGNCSKTDTLTVLQSASTTVNLGPDTCLGSATVTLNAGSGFSSYLWSTGASTASVIINLPGTYWVRVTNASGCTGSDTIVVRDSCSGTHVVVHGCIPVPFFRVLNISPTGQVTFKDSSMTTGIAKYTWTFGDGTSTNATGTQVHTYDTAGTYIITLTICDSCSADTVDCEMYTRTISVYNTGINQIKELDAVNLYPNPASNMSTLDVEATETTNLTISINDLIGATVTSREWHVSAGESKLDLDLSGMASGMYNVSVKSASGMISRKLIIVK